MLNLDKNKRYNLEYLSDERIKKVEDSISSLYSEGARVEILEKSTLYFDKFLNEWNVRNDVNYTCDALELFNPYELGGGLLTNTLMNFTSDKVVQSVMNDLNERSKIGVGKYGVTLERDDLNLKDWLQHAYEETLDKANYLKRAILEIEDKI